MEKWASCPEGLRQANKYSGAAASNVNPRFFKYNHLTSDSLALYKGWFEAPIKFKILLLIRLLSPLILLRRYTGTTKQEHTAARLQSIGNLTAGM